MTGPTMPTLPWTSGVHEPTDGEQLQVLTSRLPLNRYSDVVRFLRWTLRIRSQLRDAPGCVGYTLDARLFSKTFWTLSAWSDQEAMNNFVRSGAHAEMLSDMAGRVGNPSFVDSTATRAQIPLSWREARTRLA
ncbi:antibiotic biosynthesis monooxygenase [Nocardia sp. GCM10030253]|uniref:antibiotic biosynthesis monooxygenase n=1 Tax=Nocardia sp. GCM10030253 TaxID=3273404 RepID=UPI0036371C3C